MCKSKQAVPRPEVVLDPQAVQDAEKLHGPCSRASRSPQVHVVTFQGTSIRGPAVVARGLETTGGWPQHPGAQNGLYHSGNPQVAGENGW
ncbi:hypothetical protein CB1_000723009 [Camelus ferus]|nr:hypothetical protein CB1_000723009 [Camelus ferus]